MNTVFISGNLTRDPEMKYTPTGKAVTEFSVAVNEGYGEKRTTEYIRCQSWEKSAEFVAERARKGTHVVIEGRLKVESWNDKETGKKREMMKVVTRSVSVSTPEPKDEAAAAPFRAPAAPPPTWAAPDDESLDDLPF